MFFNSSFRIKTKTKARRKKAAAEIAKVVVAEEEENEQNIGIFYTES
jgi:hypothetical protein